MRHAIWLFIGLLAACGGGPALHEKEAVDRSAATASDRPVGPAAPAVEPAATPTVAPIPLDPGSGPAFLGFPRGGDDAVASVGAEDLRKSQVFDYLLQTMPDRVRAAIAVLLSNRVLASECARHGITVPESEIDGFWTRHRQELEARARLDGGTETDLATWLRQNLGQTPAEYERVTRDHERAARLLARLIRYHEILEDRVVFRIISVRDRKVGEQVEKMLGEGADFAALARAYSVHPSAEKGGLMNPVWRLALNPALDAAAFDLPIGGTSGVIEAKDALGQPRYQIVRIVERFKGRSVPYRSVEDEIATGLLKNPLAQEEWYMWQLKTERMDLIRYPGNR